MEVKAITVEISKLTLGPDDILVVRFPKEMNVRMIKDALPGLRDTIPSNIPILWFHGDIELTVMTRDATLSAE